MRLIESKENDVPFIRTSDLINYDVDLSPDFFLEPLIFKELDQKLKPNEVLLTKDGKVGQVAYITDHDKCILSSGFLRITANSSLISPHYLFIALSVPQVGLYQAYQRTVVATTIPHLREDRIHDFIIPFIKKDSSIIRKTYKTPALRGQAGTVGGRVHSRHDARARLVQVALRSPCDPPHNRTERQSVHDHLRVHHFQADLENQLQYH